MLPAVVPDMAAGASAPPSGGPPDAGHVAKGGKAFAAMVDDQVGSSDAAPSATAKRGTAGAGAPVQRHGRTHAAVDPLEIAEKWLLRTPSGAVVPAAADSTAAADTTAGTDDDGAQWWDVPADALVSKPAPVVVIPTAGWQLQTVHIPVPGDENADGAAASRTGVDGSATVPFDPARPVTRFNTARALARLGGPGFAKAAAMRAAGDDAGMATPADAMTQAAAAAAPATALQAELPAPSVDTAAQATANARKNGPTIDPQAARAITAALESTAAAAAPGADESAPTAAGASANANAPAAAAVTAAPAAGPKAPSAAEAASRRSESPLPVVQFADAAGNGAHGDAQDASRQEQHGGSTSARLAAAVASVSEAPAGAVHHDAVPAFAIPSTTAPAPVDVPAVADASAMASGPSIAQDNLDRVVQAMQVNTRAGVMEATVRLRPDYLGDVTINLKVDGSGVSAVVHAETPAVRQWLESHEQTIRSGLAEHGLELERFVVDPNGQQHAQRDARQDAEEQRRVWRRRQSVAAAQRFEITV
jgi:flagellar hook-length control protein FliK